MGLLRFAKTFDLAVPVGRLWPVIANTDRINRAVGLPQVSYSDPGPDGVTRLATARLGGVVPMSWDEPPFEWVEGDFYAIRRRFHGGPLAEIYTGARFAPDGARTRLTAFADVVPRGALGSLVAKAAIGGKSLRDIEHLCLGIEKAMLAGLPDPFSPSPRERARKGRLMERFDALRGKADQDVLLTLAGHLLSAADEQVVRMRPFVLADRWRQDRLKALDAFLHAARAGVLDLSWEILCPNCRVPKAAYRRLSDLKGQAHCETCGIGFDSEFDRNVEVLFTVNPAIREARDSLFCIGGPYRSPHRFAQLLVPAGSRRQELTLPEAPLYLRALRGRRRLTLLPEPGGPDSLPVLMRGGEPVQERLPFRPGRVRLELENAGPEPVWVSVDGESWSDQGATAALVTSRQEFRDLFSSEVLAPDQQVAIRSMAVVFTDLKDSTALYERIGNAKAYALVREHFRILEAAVRGRGGAVIKTIGDAVMAVFLSGEDAFRACLDMHARIRERNRASPAEEPIVIKVGLHVGPTIAVNSNEALDYFGTTVNVAARVQSQSVGGDIVATEPVFRSSEVQQEIRRLGLRAEEFSADLKGIAGSYRLWRIV